MVWVVLSLYSDLLNSSPAAIYHVLNPPACQPSCTTALPQSRFSCMVNLQSNLYFLVNQQTLSALPVRPDSNSFQHNPPPPPPACQNKASAETPSCRTSTKLPEWTPSIVYSTPGEMNPCVCKNLVLTLCQVKTACSHLSQPDKCFKMYSNLYACPAFV